MLPKQKINMHIFPLILNVIELSGNILIVYPNSKIVDFFITVSNPQRQVRRWTGVQAKHWLMCCAFLNKTGNRLCFFQNMWFFYLTYVEGKYSSLLISYPKWNLFRGKFTGSQIVRNPKKLLRTIALAWLFLKWIKSEVCCWNVAMILEH